MSDDIQQTNWLVPIFIAIVLAAPGWYLYYDTSTKTELKAKRDLFKIQRLEKKLGIVRENAASDYSNWRRRFQDANQALITANAKLRSVKSELEKMSSEPIATKDIASDFKTAQADFEEQLESSNRSNAELMVKLKEQNSRVSALTNELAQAKSEYIKAQEKLVAIQKANQKAQSQITQDSEKLDGAVSQADVYKKQNLQRQAINRQLSEEHAQLKLEFEQLKQVLSQEVKKKEVEILTLADNSTVIRLQSNILFDSASALLKDEAKPALDQIAMALQGLSYQKVSIEGHTDALQIVGQEEWHFISNWELSAARAAAAVRYLLYSNKQLDATKMQIVGHGAYSPVADNATLEGRQLNRRIEIRIISKEQREEAQ